MAAHLPVHEVEVKAGCHHVIRVDRIDQSQRNPVGGAFGGTH